jgi:S1-C subfamily serine protease
LISAVLPFPASLGPKSRALVRWLLPILPIVAALVIVAWWPRPSATRQAPATAQEPSRAAVDEQDAEEARLAEAIDRAKSSTVALEYNSGDPSGKRRVATGVVFSGRGDVISVRVEPPEGRDRDSIVARDASGREYPARFVAADPETGLSLLKVEAPEIKPILPATRSALLGAAVFLIGHPYDLGASVSVGNVAGFDRRVKYGNWPIGGLIHVQVPLHPGENGALLADRKGEWLGLIRGGLVLPGLKDDNTLGFAIPAVDAVWVGEQLRAHRKVDRAFLGVKLSNDSAKPGPEVAEVIAGSPAEKAGLHVGDRVARIDGRSIRKPEDLNDRLDRTSAGTEVVLEYSRGGVIARATIPTARRPSKALEARPAPSSTPAPAPPASPDTLPPRRGPG